MTIQAKDISLIKERFAELQTKEDLANLLSFANRIFYEENSTQIQLKQLTYYANPSLCGDRYHTFKIAKKSGGPRLVQAPRQGLKNILRSLNFVIECMYKPDAVAMGFVSGKSIVDNAKIHVGQRFVYNLDLSDFFHSFDLQRVKWGFMMEPFNLKDQREPLAFFLACLCTHPTEIDGITKVVLPQGSPVSPMLTNVLCRKLDRKLKGVANRFGLQYSRYADDITFSSQHNVYNREEFKDELYRIIVNDQGFGINQKKVRLQRAGYRQEVTGLVVNEKVNVHRNYVKQLRMYLYYWEKYGHAHAEVLFQRDYAKDKGNAKKGRPSMTAVLKGKLDFLEMVRGGNTPLKENLKFRFHQLAKPNDNPVIASAEVGSSLSCGLSFDKSAILIHEPNDLAYYNELIKGLDLNPTRRAIEKLEIIGTIGFRHPDDFLVKIESEMEKFPEFHEPEKFSNLLKCFSNNDSNLKYATHSWEYGKYQDLESFLKLIEKDWQKISQPLKELNERFHAKIWSFLFNQSLGIKLRKYAESWGEQKLKFGWSTKHLADFMEGGGREPMLCPIPKTISENETLNNLNYFLDYVKQFKREIEIREEENQLEDLFYDLWPDYLGYDFKLELKNTKGISFYTDVQAVKSAVSRIFGSFKSRPEFNEIVIQADRDFEKGSLYINIIQMGSVSHRSMGDPKLIGATGGDFSSLKKDLRNICDWSVLVHADHKYWEISYLSSFSGKKHVNEIEYCEGFTHRLTFYL